MTNEWTQSLVVTLNGRLKTEDDYFIRTIFSTQDLFVGFSRVRKETFHLSDIFFVKIWWALAVDKWCYEMFWNSFKGRCEKNNGTLHRRCDIQQFKVLHLSYHRIARLWGGTVPLPRGDGEYVRRPHLSFVFLWPSFCGYLSSLLSRTMKMRTSDNYVENIERVCEIFRQRRRRLLEVINICYYTA